MTDPQRPDVPQAEVQLLVNSGITPGPDGQPWVALSLQYGLSVHQILLPEALAEKAGPVLGVKLAEAVALARRTRLGIVLPSDPLPPNGGPPAVPRLPGLSR